MAGIYLHIPFCKKACHYCDFHFTTSLAYKNELLAAMQKEILLRKDYLDNEPVETIYFGGGTPSLLNEDDLKRLYGAIESNFNIASSTEITLEANPDDLNPQKLKEFRAAAVNRLSIGVQSFYDEDLNWMNRAHNGSEAESSLKRAQDAGFENITADLIYGFPLLTEVKWMSNIEMMVDFDIPHISAYAMTVEERTPLAAFVKNEKQSPMDEQQSAGQFLQLIDTLGNCGYEQYEISNFSLPGRYARHNTNYWNGVPYLGIGPSAHSYNGLSRQWNIANNAKYIASIDNGVVPAEVEVLNDRDKVNEYLMTGLRLSKGIDISRISLNFGNDVLQQIAGDMQEFIEKGWVADSGDRYALTLEGKLFADRVAAGVMLV